MLSWRASLWEYVQVFLKRNRHGIPAGLVDSDPWKSHLCSPKSSRLTRLPYSPRVTGREPYPPSSLAVQYLQLLGEAHETPNTYPAIPPPPPALPDGTPGTQLHSSQSFPSLGVLIPQTPSTPTTSPNPPTQSSQVLQACSLI